MGPAERVRELVEPVLEASDLELVDVEVLPGVLRLSVDRPGGIDLDAIAAVSHAISAALDASDPIPERYSLEVSSPGLERPLRTPEHFRRFVGSTITVRTHGNVPGERRMKGTLAAADDTGIDLTPDEGDQSPRRLAYTDIERARTVFEWGPAPRPGRPSSTRSRRKASAP